MVRCCVCQCDRRGGIRVDNGMNFMSMYGRHLDPTTAITVAGGKSKFTVTVSITVLLRVQHSIVGKVQTVTKHMCQKDDS